MILVVGAKGTILNIENFLQQILEFSQHNSIVVQAIDAEVVYGQDHLVSATEHAVRAFAQGRQSTNSLELEILLYASGERQIQKAIPKMGVKKGKHAVAFVLVDESKRERKAYENLVDRLLKTIKFIRDDTVLEGDRETMTRFGIGTKELQTIPDTKYGELILEKVALVDIIK